MNPFLQNTFEIKWSQLKPEYLDEAISLAISNANENIEKIIQLPNTEVSYANTFGALEKATEMLDRAWGDASHLSSVCDSTELRDAYNAKLGEVSAFYSSLGLNESLWNSLKRFADDSQAVNKLTNIQQRHVSETAQDFIESGIDLPVENKERIREINAELSELTKNFSEKILDSTNAWELILTDESELEGIPEMNKSALRQDAIQKDNKYKSSPAWRITAQAPSFRPVMMNAHSSALREQVWRGVTTVGTNSKHGDYDTSDEIRKIIALRQEKSTLLGYANFADFVTKRRMSGSGNKALRFIENLHEKIEAQFQKEVTELENYKNEKTNSLGQKLAPWDVSYWSEQRRKAEFNFDDDELRPYFSVEKVMAGMFDLSSTLFGIKIKEKASTFNSNLSDQNIVETWHEEVKFYEVYDLKSNQHLGSFYADWHPRESKRGGAWMNQLRVGNPAENQAHLGLIIGNMTKPVNGNPALLTHEEVETIFHEFGHLLHLLLTTVPVKSLAGTNVPWDFVELPSQLMENFCWNRKTLDTFALHFETNETIPDELFKKMLNARNYMSASACMRQLSFAKLDLKLHLDPNLNTGIDLNELDNQIIGSYKMQLSEASPTILRQFGHLFSDPTGYAAGYYSYKWAEVLDADAFTKFEESGTLSSEVGLSFREEILSKGNSLPVEQLFKNFRGRDPELQALLDRNGLD